MSFNIAALVLPATEYERGHTLARWLQIDSKLINLDQVTIISPRKKAGEVEAGANINFVNGDGLYTGQSVYEVYRLIESAEGPEPPRARLVAHEFVPALGSVYECLDCTLPQKAHAR